MSDKRNKRELKFDEIMGFDGAYQILKTQGFDALVRELTRRGLSHKAKQIDLAQTAQRLEESIQRRKSTGFDLDGSGGPARDNPASAIDESLLIEDDAARLAAKANKLGVSEQAHNRLLMTLDTQTLERVYNRALVDLPAAGHKAMPDDEYQALLVFQTEPLLPEIVMEALSKELGDSLFYHVLEDLRLSLVFGPNITPKAYTPPNRATINHPTFGASKVKGDVPHEPGTHPTFGVPYKR